METNGRRFPNRLRKHRKLARLTQREVAHFLGIRQNRVSAWENGKALPSLIYLFKLCILYKTLSRELYYDMVKELQKEMDALVLPAKQTNSQGNK
ncbi:MAG: helix-turn-helix transcriptional regulator [Bacteroidota bacterium]